MPLEEALLSLQNRVDSADLALVITAVLIQRQVGGNLAEVLETGRNEIHIDEGIRRRAHRSVERMLTFARGRQTAVLGHGNA